MATYITVEQQVAQQLLEANARQTAANRAGLARQERARESQRQLPPAVPQINPPARRPPGNEELSAARRSRPVDVLMIKLRWTTGADYDLNVGFAQTIQYPGGLRPTTGEKLPGFDDYVGWTFFERYAAHNFMYHTGDNTEEGESGEAYEAVFIDLTRAPVNMPVWAQSFIRLELRSYWYEEAASTQLDLSVFPVRIPPGELPFDPTNPAAEVTRFTSFGLPYKKSLSFSTNVGTNKVSGDLGELIATMPINLTTRTWKFERYQAVP